MTNFLFMAVWVVFGMTIGGYSSMLSLVQKNGTYGDAFDRVKKRTLDIAYGSLVFSVFALAYFLFFVK
jgi:hypothetical protein